MSKELGKIGQKRYNGIFYEEFVPELVGRYGVEAYKEMSNNDETIGAIMFAMEMLMRQCDFNVSPGGNTAKDKEAAQFVEECMNDMEYTWTDTISEILSFLTYGWSYHEIVYKVRNGKKKNKGFSSKYNDGLIGWKKLPIRSQDTLYEWRFDEQTDDLLGMVQSPPPNYEQIFIPIEKALHFTTKSVKANPEGRSILRTAYRSWYFKKRIQEIEGIGIERDLAGFPTLEAPEGFEDLWDPEDQDMAKALANATAIVSGIRRDEREGLVVPPGWKLNLLSTGSRRQFDTNQIIERYDNRMAQSVMADFIFLGHESVGSFALSSSKTKLFSLAVGTYLDIICEVFNNQAIPRLIDMNGDHFNGITQYPQLNHGDIEEPDIDKFANYLKTLIGTGIIVPDEELEDYARRIGGLPERKPGEHRDYTSQQDSGQQSASENATEGTESTPKQESASVYKIISIIDKYRSGKADRSVSEKLLQTIGCEQADIEFYLNSVDNGRDLTEQQIAAAENDKGGTGAAVDPENNMDEKEKQQAEEAKKSLGRSPRKKR